VESDTPQVAHGCGWIDLYKWSSQNGNESLLSQIVSERVIAADRSKISPYPSLMIRNQGGDIPGPIRIR
jgi:hypothetical protein